jgi:GNAT superfamily N-acetyltransferase
MNQLTAAKPPKLATADRAAKLVDLLCTASREIGLKEDLCRPENIVPLLSWMKAECDAQRVWTLTDGSALQGMLILKENLSGILYVVVAERFRGRGVGPALISHVQSLAVGSLDAEARNDRSRRMLKHCGFYPTGDFSFSGHPILLWQR